MWGRIPTGGDSVGAWALQPKADAESMDSCVYMDCKCEAGARARTPSRRSRSASYVLKEVEEMVGK